MTIIDTEISCVRLDKTTENYIVELVGGMNEDGTRWRLKEIDAIEGVRTKNWRFYIHIEKVRYDLHIAKNAEGRDFFTTIISQSDQNNKLLLMPECA